MYQTTLFSLLDPESCCHSACHSACAIKIVDFGEAFLFRECIPELLHTPVWYAAPEALFHEPGGPPSDVWALGYLIYRALGCGVLFKSFDGRRDEVLVMVRTFGKLPDHWWHKWEKRADYFMEDGRSAGNGPEELKSAEILAYTLQKMLQFEPEERILAEIVVQLMRV
ncbi:kinase-like domain-containing protein [Trichophaea hybrida]|nr:kinase-like domain-containing protein [Trichophaea hybrida]